MSRSVYVLGAGASKHIGYPLASTMGAEMLTWMSVRELYKDTADSIRETFGDSPNIEEVVTELEGVVESLEHSSETEDRIRRSIASSILVKVREAVPIWFTEIHTNPAPAYQQFAEKLVQPGDTVITFNYDDSLERELKRVGKWDIAQGYGFRIVTATTASQVLVLKLHGSMNWLVSIFNGMTGPFAIGDNRALGQSPRIATNYLRYLGYDDMPGTFPRGGGFPSLILPSRTKEFYYQTSFGQEHQEFFSYLWSQAAAALKCADKIVLCGYSLLPVDQRACDLLLTTPRKETSVMVVSGRDGERISKSFRSAGFQNVGFHQNGYFENWVSESIDANTRDVPNGATLTA
jgi:hypothetical protein